MHKLNKQLKKNLDNWVEDRAVNKEPLMLNDFYTFMRDLDFTTEDLKPLKNKSFREKVKKKYQELKKCEYCV
jgi:hypothetical protein